MCNVYVYQAALYCEACGTDMVARKAGRVRAWQSQDSDYCPQGPYSAGGGEADCPQHCGGCGEFLQNPLTADGLAYVRDKVTEWRAMPDPVRRRQVIALWADFYGL